MPLNFPNSPSIGQTYGRYVWNGTAWTLMAEARNFVDLVLLSSGTWTKPVGLAKLEIAVIGAGGGSTGAPTTGAGQASAGSGGGGGAVVLAIYDADELDATEAYTIGAYGTAPSGIGGAGGASTFKGLTAGGGGGGGAMMTAGNTAGMSPSVGGAGVASESPSRPTTKLLHGGNAGQGVRCPHGVVNYAIGGMGGGNYFARTYIPTYVTTAYQGTVGAFPGGGAGGGGSGQNQSSLGGNFGGAGAIFMREWYQ